MEMNPLRHWMHGALDYQPENVPVVVYTIPDSEAGHLYMDNVRLTAELTAALEDRDTLAADVAAYQAERDDLDLRLRLAERLAESRRLRCDLLTGLFDNANADKARHLRELERVRRELDDAILAADLLRDEVRMSRERERAGAVA